MLSAVHRLYFHTTNYCLYVSYFFVFGWFVAVVGHCCICGNFHHPQSVQAPTWTYRYLGTGILGVLAETNANRAQVAVPSSCSIGVELNVVEAHSKCQANSCSTASTEELEGNSTFKLAAYDNGSHSRHRGHGPCFPLWCSCLTKA